MRPSAGRSAPAFLGASILVLGTAVYTQANLLFWLFGLSVGAAVFAAAHGSLALRGVAVTRLPPVRCVAGEPLSIGYQIRNRGRIACLSVRIREVEGASSDPPPDRESIRGLIRRLPWAWVARVGPGETRRAVAAGVAPRRGEHELAAFEVSTCFPLGLFRWRRVHRAAATLRVLPAPVPVAPEVVARAARPRPGPGGVSPRATPGVEGDFYGTRGYRPGDPLRTLDWKRSARQGELMVRELATPEPPRVAILLDLRAPQHAEPPGVPAESASRRADAGAERAISLAASLVARAHAAGFRVGLHVVGVACPAFTPHHALAHRDRLLAALGRIDLSAAFASAEPHPRVAREATVVVSVAPNAEALLRFASNPAARSAGRAPDSAPAVSGGVTR